MDTPTKHVKRYKAIMIEDGSTIQTGWFHPLTARKDMENHSDYHVLRYGKDYVIVRDLELEQSNASTPAKVGRSKAAKARKLRIRCNQCEACMINGVFCHEIGCPNSGARYDAGSGEWVKQRKCFECGCTVDADDPCCSGDATVTLEPNTTYTAHIAREFDYLGQFARQVQD